jgi:hypothetical protein
MIRRAYQACGTNERPVPGESTPVLIIDTGVRTIATNAPRISNTNLDPTIRAFSGFASPQFCTFRLA